MAQIELKILADSAGDLRSTVSALALSWGGNHAPVSDELDRGEVSQGEPEAGAEAAADPTPARRTRKKADATPTSATAATEPSGAATAADPLGLGSGQGATAGASTSDAEAMALLMGETGAAAEVVTKDQVAGALRACMDKGIAMPALQEIFVKHGNGAKSIGQVDASLYGAVLAGFNALLAA